jgi:hypothetical protein
MIYRFLILSDEVDDFAREISIDSEATFFDFHSILLDSVKYKKDQMTSFFLCSEDWEKEQEITLVEMDSSSEYDNLVMSETILHDYIEDEGQKLLYIFDYISERAFFIELKEIIPSKYLAEPVCSLSKGVAPEQITHVDTELSNGFESSANIDESFYGDEGFELDELDEEGFSGINEELSTNEDSNF